MFKNILIPTDGSPRSHKAIGAGVALAKSLGAKVTGLFAAPPATPIIYRDSLPVGYATPAEHARMIEKTAKKAGVTYEGVSVTSDYPADAVLDIAKKKKCDAIVMATQGQSGLRGVFVGSVTQQVINQSKIPVLVLR